MTTWLDLETEQQWVKPETRKLTMLEQLQEIIDSDVEAVQCLKRIKRKGLFHRIIIARRHHGVSQIPLKELRKRIQTYVEEDHCYQ